MDMRALLGAATCIVIAGCSRTELDADVTIDAAVHADASGEETLPEASSPFDVAAPDSSSIDATDEPDAPPLIDDGPGSFNYQINAAHSGFQPVGALTFPLSPRWSTDVGDAPAFPLVAGGRLFVITRNVNKHLVNLIALDEKTGSVLWGPIDLNTAWGWAGHAVYDQGRVYTLIFEGALTAFDPQSGNTLWTTQLLPQNQAPWFESAPTAIGGVIYVWGVRGGTVYAVRESDGAILWQTGTLDYNIGNSPAVSNGLLHVSDGCHAANALDITSGKIVWQYYPTSCSGGGGPPDGVFGPYDYSTGVGTGVPNVVFDAANGTLLGGFAADEMPASANGVGYFVYKHALSAAPLLSSIPTWTFSSDAIITAPIIVDAAVIVASSTTLYALSTVDGSALSSVAITGCFADDGNASSGLSAADGMVFVPAGTSITAF